MTKDLYLATYCVGSGEEVLAPLYKVCSLLLALRREHGIALFEWGLLRTCFSLPLSWASALAIVKSSEASLSPSLPLLIWHENVRVCCGCSSLSVECVWERLLWGCKWMDIQLMNLDQAYEMGLELLDSAKRPPFCRCREQICELPATWRSRD